MKIQHKWWALISLVAMLVGSGLAVAGISTTKHNLSASGTGTYKATSENQLCIYCHAPHNTNPASPLWNHALSGATYTPYSSKTLAAAAPGQPTGASRLCLSCHDGTVALGSVKNLPFAGGTGVITGLGAAILGTSPTVLGTDLRNDHPISFNYDATLLAKNTEIVNPSALPSRFKPGDGQLQCSNCHDPHSDANPKFMLTGYQDGAGEGSPLCRTCHTKMYWGTVPNNSHRTSTAQWNGTGINPWHIAGQNLPNNANSTPKANGCENCHQPHNGASTEHLLKKPGANQSSVCLTCHNGNVAAPTKSIDATLAAMYTHPIKDPAHANRHESTRQADGKVREDQTALANRHAECADCHNPHAASAGVSPSWPAATNNLASKVLKGVWGVQPNWPGNWGTIPQTGGYTTVDDIQYQFQLCLKCHSSYAFGATPPAEPYLKGTLTDIAQEFNPNNESYHPVVQQGRNPYVKGSSFAGGKGTGTSYAGALINGMTPTSTMTCADCHDNAIGTTGPKGPHGSPNWPILSAPWNNTTGGSGTSNHLCFQCHSYDVYTGGGHDGDSSGSLTGYSDGSKNLHAYHVGDKNAKCQYCHAAVPHGWKRPHLLIYGVGTGRDPAPYNGHYTQQVGIPYNFGSCCGVTLETVKSGQYKEDMCHKGAGVGSCD